MLELRDAPERYQTEERDGVPYLARGPGGDCIYLQAGGCSIYESRPLECQMFDCRVIVESGPWLTLAAIPYHVRLAASRCWERTYGRERDHQPV